MVAGYPPVLRVHGELHELEPEALEPETVRGLLIQTCPPHALERFREDRNADFALDLPLDTVGEGKGDRSNLCEAPSGPFRQIGPVPFSRLQRFRANYFMSGQQMGACFRVIPSEIPDFQWAGFPEELAGGLAHYRNGLVLLCGVVGSGKTTSLAMLINLLNKEGGYRIITVEEPVEYLFPKAPGSVVTQREVGLDVHTFADGLKYALRQDPDVILVGEIRDRETAQMALSAAETGHLVFSTLHTRDAKGAISRVCRPVSAERSSARSARSFP